MQTSNLRQTLALLYCDMAGTTPLIAQEGDLVASAVLRDFFEHSGRLGKEHHCAWMKFLGDGFISTFEQIDRVLPFAASIQNLLNTVPSLMGWSLGFRFSLHYADVLSVDTSYGSDIFGDAVNIVARLNELARRGQIVITEAALDRMPLEQRALVGPGEIAAIKTTEDLTIYRIRLNRP